MFDLTSVPATDPVDIYRVRDGIYAADMLLTALVHLDLFSWLAEHPATKDEICRAFDIDGSAGGRDVDAARGDGACRGAAAGCFT